MYRFNHDTLRNLLTTQDGPCISIYLELQKPYWSPRNIVNYQRLLKDAERQLLLRYSRSETSKILTPIRFFSSLYCDLNEAQTVCFFSSSKEHGFFPIVDKVKNKVVVAPSFHIKPIASYLNPMDCWLGIEISYDYIQFNKGYSKHIEPLRRINRERWAKNGNHTAAVALMEQWMCIQKMSPQTPVFVYGPEDQLKQFTFSENVHTFFTTGPEADAHLVDRVSLMLSFARETKICHLNRRIAHNDVIHDLSEIVRKLETKRIETLAVCIDKTRWGQVDWQNGLIRSKPTGQFLDCVLDDLAERALVNRTELILCKRDELVYDFEAVATLRKEHSKERRFYMPQAFPRYALRAQHVDNFI